MTILEDVDHSDFTWRDSPGAWHQQMARIVDHRFSSFDELYTFALNAKKAGVSAVMLVEIQKTSAAPARGTMACSSAITSTAATQRQTGA